MSSEEPATTKPEEETTPEEEEKAEEEESTAHFEPVVSHVDNWIVDYFRTLFESNYPMMWAYTLFTIFCPL